MGRLDFMGGNSKELDHYELRFMPPGSSTWQVPEFDHDLGDVSSLQETLDKNAVQNTAETEGWPSGKYKLQGRYVDGTMADTEWTFDHEGPDDDQPADRELTTEEKILETQTRMLEKMDDGMMGHTTSPDEAMGRLFDMAIDDERVGWNQLTEFVQSWRGPPTDPDEFAGAMVQSQLEAGNQEAAAALLNDWMGSRGGGGDSLLDLATNLDADDLNMDSIKAIGMLKFLDDPASMTRDVASGMLQANADAASGGSTGGPVDGLFDVGGGGAGGQEADETVETAEPVDEGPAPAADAEESAGEPGVDPGASAADFDVAVDPEESADETAAETDAEPAEVSVGTDAGAAAFEDETPASAAPAETQIEPDAAADGGGDSFDEVKEELEDRADAGDPASADEAIERMSDAAGDEGGED